MAALRDRGGPTGKAWGAQRGILAPLFARENTGKTCHMQNKMNAVYQNSCGASDVLKFGCLQRPVAGANRVLVKVHASSINPRDGFIRMGRYQLQFLVPAFPLVLGSDLAGTVVAVGAGVTQFKVGDAVIGIKNPSQGLACHAEFVAVDASALARKPTAMSFTEAGGLPLCALTAWQALIDHGRIRAGHRVLVIGASGGVGTFAVQIARALGTDVTGVCSAANADMVHALGASRTVDYRQPDYKLALNGFDVVFDTIGRENLHACRTLLNPGGVFVSTIPSPRNLRLALVSTVRSWLQKTAVRAAVVMVKACGTDLARIAALVEQGKVRTVVDSVFPLAQAAQAHDRSRSQRARGKIILQVRDAVQ